MDDYDRLRELILLEDFLNKIEPEVRTYLVDKNVKTSSQAAELAQDYYLVRKHDKSQTRRRVSGEDLLCPTVHGSVVLAVSTEIVPGCNYSPYLSSGCVWWCGEMYPVRILRDTGASISLWVKPPQSDISELSANFCGPYVIERRIGMTDYLVRTPDRRKKYQLCHINMLKPYYRNESSPTPAPVVRATAVVTTVGEDVDVDFYTTDVTAVFVPWGVQRRSGENFLD
ncbi:hypothetical protein Pcinc_010341 [Petrolisthes cinctipes]|uniref:Integrase p58-like C-terminal domain-containing protein n=1 Tax=Petrolisthes cinctipes TaxID=88211 RepID=A0AAE1G526_PETCI|nr:hypothetical protein Pcinc_010341 [Petrolisthes cinctipes]